ncbi:hypothetical protein ACWEGE_06610 [Amycolatopsis sp. NPDC004747]
MQEFENALAAAFGVGPAEPPGLAIDQLDGRRVADGGADVRASTCVTRAEPVRASTCMTRAEPVRLCVGCVGCLAELPEPVAARA